MNLQYLTESIHLLPICSIMTLSGGGYCNRANCCQSLLKHCICSIGKAMQLSGYLKRLPP
jgi:hypothetical protein